jgi:cell cycle checkpoint protein
VTFEIQLNILIDCLNIFGTAGNPNPSFGSTHKKWRRADRDDGPNHSDDDGRDGRQTGPIDRYFVSGGSEKKTGMRMTYVGAGYPLTLLMCVLVFLC